MNFIEVFVSVPAFFFVVVYFYRIYKKQPFSVKRFDNYSKIIGSLFLFFVILNTGLQMHTVNTQETNITSPGWFFYQRWVVKEYDETYSVQLINQITQNVERTYHYNKLSWNMSELNLGKVNQLISEAKEAINYQKYLFRLEPNSKTIYNVSYNLELDKWAIMVTEIVNDAQLRYFGLDGDTFSGTAITIFVED